MRGRNLKQKIIWLVSKITLPVIRLYWFVFRPKNYGVKCMIENRGEILLVRHTYGKGLWTLPGGTISRNEDPESAVKREIKEELGIEINNFKKIGELFDDSEYVKDYITCFSASVGSREMRIDKNEILETRWFTLDNLPPLSNISKRILSLWQGSKK